MGSDRGQSGLRRLLLLLGCGEHDAAEVGADDGEAGEHEDDGQGDGPLTGGEVGLEGRLGHEGL
jgi:hypothetical protein